MRLDRCERRGQPVTRSELDTLLKFYKGVEMNDDIKNKLLEYMSSADAFLKDQVPDVVSQLLKYEVWSLTTRFDIVFGLTILCVLMFVLLCALLTKDKEWAGPAVCAFIIGLLLTIASVASYWSLKELELAPKVYMLKLVKGML